jgi:dolichyl-phosphate-mannose--protein O-mannosyl transferase
MHKPAAPEQSRAQELNRRLLTSLCYTLVFAIAYICFVASRANPPYIFWDENYHVTSAERYLEGVAHFEPHPPLGLMLIAVGRPGRTPMPASTNTYW